MIFKQKIDRFKDVAKSEKFDFEYDDNFLFVLFKGSKYISQYHCKEEALSDYSEDEAILCAFYLPDDKGWGEEVIRTIHRIEDSLGISNSKLQIIECGYEEILAFESNFWKGPIKFDMFCCIYKTLMFKNLKQLKEIKDYTSINSGEYFCSQILRGALKNIKKLRTILNLNETTEDQFLFNFDCAGLISALENWKYDYPERAKKLV